MRLFLLLMLAFTTIPVIDLALLLAVGHYLGGWNTFGIVVVTGAIGAWLARHQGTAAWRNVRRTLQAGRLPGRELVEALLILIAGILLITPGLLTDLAGFLLLWPACRGVATRFASRQIARRFQPLETNWGMPQQPRPAHSRNGSDDGQTIDVKATSETIDE